MLCLMKKPPKLTQFPGVTNRYEDFVAVHINQTLSIHGTGSFLSWHRYYTWAFEQALRTECGYNGTQPVSPLFPEEKTTATTTDYPYGSANQPVLGLGPLGQGPRVVAHL